MNNENRPHSREKTVGNGSANVNKGRKINTGGMNVGSGGRTGANSANRYSGRPSERYTTQTKQTGTAPVRINFKTIVLILVAVILVISLLRCLGNSPEVTDYSSYSDYGGSMSGSGYWTDSSSSDTGNTGSAGSSSAWGTGSLWSGSDSGSDSNGSSSWSSTSANGAYYSNSNVNGASYEKPDVTVSEYARSKFYTPSKNDRVTIMIYMCGTDLESQYGMATKDLNEMVSAQISDNVNVIVETGGCKQWRNSTISSSYNQVYKLGYKSIVKLEDNFGSAAMTDPDNLTKFIKYCCDNYPAERRILIFWDHGGGSISGYGYDEKYPNSSSMTLSKINSALKNADCTYDFIGFDACLMATLETDLVCSNYADYIIASEESEPGTGWYYTNWLTQLSNDTSISTVELSKTLIDDFVSTSCSSSYSAQVTLSIVDLSELSETIPGALSSFASSTNELISSGNYQQVSDARAGTRQFAQKSRLNQVDLIDLAQRIGTDEAETLADALKECVKYNKTTISRSNGISIYFPYETTTSVKSAINSYNSIGSNAEYSECLEEYTECIKSFASLEYGGQIAASASQTSSGYSSGYSDWSSLLGALISSGNSYSSSPIYVLSGAYSKDRAFASGSAGNAIDASTIMSLLGKFDGFSMPSELDWVNTGMIAENAGSIADKFIDPSRITASMQNGRRVLTLTDEEWKLIQTVELNVFAYDGEGYIDLGLDNTFEWLDNDSLLLEYDGTWLTLNGKVCAYYLVSDTQQGDGSWVTVGRIPALLNGQFVNLQVVFDDWHPEGSITGAYPMYSEDVTDVQAKGDIEINVGDTIELLCDFYDLNGNYTSSYTLGTSFTVPDSGLKLQNLKINTDGVSVTYRLTDIYGNYFWVPVE